MKELAIYYKKPSGAERFPSVYLTGPGSMEVSNELEFQFKFRLFLDRLENYKYIDNFRFYSEGEMSEDERALHYRYSKIASDVCRKLKLSFGSYEDSLIGIRNFFSNMNTILECPDLSQLRLERKPFDAIVVSAGPSLEKSLSHLKKIQGQVLVVAVDVTLKRLLKEGVVPNIVVSTERMRGSEVFLKSLPQDLKTLFVGQPTVPQDFFANYPGPMATISKFTGYFLWLPFDRAKLWAGSSSAHSAYRVAAFLGARRIGLVGQDLCYHPESFQSHADLVEKPEWCAAAKSEELIESAGAFWVRGNTVTKVLTNPVWDQFVQDYSLMIIESKIPTANLSDWGRVIPAAPYQDLSSWAADLPAEGPKLSSFEFEPSTISKNAALLLNKIADAEEKLSDLQNSIEKSVDFMPIYQSLLSYPHFLELVLELVVRDFAELEGNIFSESDTLLESTQLFKSKLLRGLRDISALLAESKKNVSSLTSPSGK